MSEHTYVLDLFLSQRSEVISSWSGCHNLHHWGRTTVSVYLIRCLIIWSERQSLLAFKGPRAWFLPLLLSPAMSHRDPIAYQTLPLDPTQRKIRILHRSQVYMKEFAASYASRIWKTRLNQTHLCRTSRAILPSQNLSEPMAESYKLQSICLLFSNILATRRTWISCGLICFAHITVNPELNTTELWGSVQVFGAEELLAASPLTVDMNWKSE